MKKFVVFIAKIVDRFMSVKVNLYAAETTLFLLISAIPFVILLTNLAQFVMPFTEHDILSTVDIIVPHSFVPVVNSIISEIYTVPSIPVLSLTAIGALWAASKGFFSIVKGLNAICSPTPTPYITHRIYSLFYTFVFIIAILITLTLSALGSSIISVAEIHLPSFLGLLLVIDQFKTAGLFVFLTLLFAVAYKTLPAKKLKFTKQLPGAILAAAAWLIFSHIFSIYIENFSNYASFYGSLATIVLFVLWLYFCINIFLVGALVNEVN